MRKNVHFVPLPYKSASSQMRPKLNMIEVLKSREIVTSTVSAARTYKTGRLGFPRAFTPYCPNEPIHPSPMNCD